MVTGEVGLVIFLARLDLGLQCRVKNPGFLLGELALFCQGLKAS